MADGHDGHAGCDCDHGGGGVDSAGTSTSAGAITGTADTTAELRLTVPEMDCPSCASKIERNVRRLPGIREIDPRPTSGTLVVQYVPSEIDSDGIRKRVEETGYAVESERSTAESREFWRSGRTIKTAVGGVLLAIGLLLEWFLPGLNPELGTVGVGGVGIWTVTGAWVAYIGAVLVAGVPILRNGYYSARTRNLDIHLLMSAGILGAIAIDHPFEAATLAVLFSTAELLERVSMDRARNSLRELMELSPDTATVITPTGEETVPTEDVAVGDHIAVRPGERIPLDGVVVDGESAVDESPITGESVPADKHPGDEVFAGSVNDVGYLEIEVTSRASESTIARVVDLVAEASAEDTEIEQFVDRFASVYTPIVVAGALVTMFVPPALGYGPFSTWFVRGLALIVIACPCAFVISTPVSVVSGITAAARNGVLIKSGTHLEAAGAADTVAVDKTGTLTTGELGVTDVVPLSNTDERDLLRCARSLEARSEHPVATAIVDRASELGVDPREIEDFEAIAGKGVRADLDGVTHYAGKPGLFTDLGFDLEHAHLETDGGETPHPLSTDGRSSAGRIRPEDQTAAALDSEAEPCDHGRAVDLVNETIPRLQREGKTVILVGTETRLEGVIAVADTLRPEAAWTVDRLHGLGIERVVMLTGDNERTARAIADRVGIDDVRADLLPAEKVAAVRDLDAAGDGVIMVGDGINDAPALAAATVGVAMGAAGTDTALETADAALMGDDLTRLPYLYDLSVRADRVIKGNIGASLGVKAILAAGAPFGYVTVAMAVLVGDMGMSLGVTGNAMRLAQVEPAEPPVSAESGSVAESPAPVGGDG